MCSFSLPPPFPPAFLSARHRIRPRISSQLLLSRCQTNTHMMPHGSQDPRLSHGQSNRTRRRQVNPLPNFFPLAGSHSRNAESCSLRKQNWLNGIRNNCCFNANSGLQDQVNPFLNNLKTKEIAKPAFPLAASLGRGFVPSTSSFSTHQTGLHQNLHSQSGEQTPEGGTPRPSGSHL